MLFEEKLHLFAELLKEGPVTWSGRTRPPLTGQRVFPPTDTGPMRAWVGVGGSPESVVRAARYGFPLMLAIIGGAPRRFAPYVELYHRALAEFGRCPAPDRRALARAHRGLGRAGARRAVAALLRRSYANRWRTRLAADEPGAVRARDRPEAHSRRSAGNRRAKIVDTVKALGLARFDMKYSNGTLPHEKLMRSIELYGTKVVPLVKKALAKAAEGARPTGP